MPYEQMSSASVRYPVDRYLEGSSKKFEMVNIIDDDLWNTEPALKPEDELILRKLHEMLQSTADDLKLLSGELSKFHQPGVQVKTAPIPLDEEFNEKVHIEEIVNAKFHGYKIIDQPSSCLPEFKISHKINNDNVQPLINTKTPKVNNIINEYHVNTEHVDKKPLNKKLGITRTKVIQINGSHDNVKTGKLNNGKVVNAPAVVYNEYSYKYVEPKIIKPSKVLQVQEMPCINIRSELKEQKVLQLDIVPEIEENENSKMITNNVAVIALKHDMPEPVPGTKTLETFKPITHHHINKPAVRKVSKMSTCDSSGSNNMSSDTQMKLNTQKRLLTTITSPKMTKRNDRKKINSKKETEKRSRLNLDEWRKKLNVVYGFSSTTKNNKLSNSKNKHKISPKKTNTPQTAVKQQKTLNNVEYIPYSMLTIGGAKVSDIEKELASMPNKTNIPLSPIVDKILNSRENSFTKNSPRKPETSNNLKVLTTSDENLLQEVIDIEKTVSETLSKNLKSSANEPKCQTASSDTEEAKENESYVDDFEDEKSNHSGQCSSQRTNRHSSKHDDVDQNIYSSDNDEDSAVSLQEHNMHDLTYTKISNLSFKNKIDVFEYVHAVDTQDTATQSNRKQKITPKETQTSPRNDSHMQPIHNELWPSMDPNGRVEKMFELEKEYIKKIILEEYGDILEKNISKPSTSKVTESTTNEAALQKNTQTSPAHVKNIMTSPTRTKTRTTSPFSKLTVHQHTSPLIFVSNENDVKLDIESEDLAISVNLSSPRFSLRLPQNSQEVLSNLGDTVSRIEKTEANETRKNVTGSKSARVRNNNTTTTSTSTVEADSSEISSLGEIRLRRMFGKMKLNEQVHNLLVNTTDCESVSSISSNYSSDLQSGILPLRSEGELILKKKSNRHYRSEGEASFGFK